MNRTTLFTFLGSAFALILAFPAAAAETAPADADQILRAMSAKLAAARQLSFDARREVDEALCEGGAIPRDARIEVTLSRPDKFVAKSTSSGDVRHFYFDGRKLTLFDATNNFYATVPMRTTIDGLVERIGATYGFMPPLAELALSDVYADIRHKAQHIANLGTAHHAAGFLGLGGVECHRLALRGRVVDAELWVGVKDQLPRKLIVTVKGRAGQPQIKTEFTDWDLAATAAARDFVFAPPRGATKIAMLTPAEAARKKAAPKKK